MATDPTPPTGPQLLRLLAREVDLSERFVALLGKGGDRLEADVLALECELQEIDEQLGEVAAERWRELADQVEAWEAGKTGEEP